jgi:hypothetical protein
LVYRLVIFAWYLQQVSEAWASVSREVQMHVQQESTNKDRLAVGISWSAWHIPTDTLPNYVWVTGLEPGRDVNMWTNVIVQGN